MAPGDNSCQSAAQATRGIVKHIVHSPLPLSELPPMVCIDFNMWVPSNKAAVAG